MKTPYSSAPIQSQKEKFKTSMPHQPNTVLFYSFFSLCLFSRKRGLLLFAVIHFHTEKQSKKTNTNNKRKTIPIIWSVKEQNIMFLQKEQQQGVISEKNRNVTNMVHITHAIGKRSTPKTGQMGHSAIKGKIVVETYVAMDEIYPVSAR